MISAAKNLCPPSIAIEPAWRYSRMSSCVSPLNPLAVAKAFIAWARQIDSPAGSWFSASFASLVAPLRSFFSMEIAASSVVSWP